MKETASPSAAPASPTDTDTGTGARTVLLALLARIVPRAVASPRLTLGGNPPAGSLRVTVNVSAFSISSSSVVATAKVWRNPAPVASAAKCTDPLDCVKSSADAVSSSARLVAYSTVTSEAGLFDNVTVKTTAAPSTAPASSTETNAASLASIVPCMVAQW